MGYLNTVKEVHLDKFPSICRKLKDFNLTLRTPSHFQ
jgi:hypothetical protein